MCCRTHSRNMLRSSALATPVDEAERVEYQERLKRRVASTLVAIDKRMVPDEREPECNGLGCKVGIEVFPTERHPRLGQCGFKGSEIANRR